MTDISAEATLENQESTLATSSEAPSTDSPVLGVTDIQNAVAIIDFACEQGAFKGWQTIEQVYGVRNKLAAFLSVVTASQQA